MPPATRDPSLWRPHVPDLLTAWAPSGDDPRHMRITGSLVFVDISGFTTLTERLARHGHVGAEEMSDLLDGTFGALLDVARSDGGDLVKWGGDAVLLLFDGPGHEVRAARAAREMRATLREVGTLRSTAGTVHLRMSVGVHSGPIDFFLVGDPDVHRELLVVGAVATRTAELEGAASAGQVVLSERTARALAARHRRPGPVDGSVLLQGRPLGFEHAGPHRAGHDDGLDVSGFVPRALREQVLAGQGEAEHRTVTVGFLRFSGVDRLARTDGLVATAAALDAAVRAVQAATEANAVTFLETDIDKDGFKVMLVSGAPRTRGHDEERMLRTVRSVVDAGVPLGVQAGVNRGHVFTGGFGPPFRRTFSVKGDAVNLAARLMARAAVGEVYVAPDVLSRSDTRFVTEDLEPFRVKGKAAPVRASRIGPALGHRGAVGTSGLFVGREREMASMRRALLAAVHGTGRQVEVVGEPGIGKTRLVEEVLAARPDLRVVRGPCDEYESSTPYFPMRRLLREALGLPGDATATAARHRLVNAVEDQAPELRPWLPLLALPLDVDVPATPETSDLDEQFRKSRLEQAVADLLDHLLPEAAVLLVEDAHLMDDASADLFDNLGRRIGSRPWLLVVTRQEHPAGYVPRRGAHLLSITVPELGQDERSELARAATESRPMAHDTLAALVDRSGGNPMFLEALLQDADQHGVGAALPESVESLVTSQVDRLDPLDRTVLRYAAVLGVSVDRAVLESLLAEHLEGVRLPDRMAHLDGFLVEEAGRGYRFRHALMRDVAYEGLPYRRRQPLHAHVAAILERGTDSPESRCEVLSFHFFHAGAHDRAWRYALLAGRRARAKYANAEAVDFYQRAVESARRGASVPDLDLAAAQEELGDSHFLLGAAVPAAEAFTRARRLVRADNVRVAGLVVKLSRVDQRQREFSRSLRRLSRSLDSLRGDERPEARAARAYLADRYAVSRFSQGRVTDALRWGSLAAREAEDAADKAALAQAYAVLNAVCVATGQPEDLPYGLLALQAYTELGELAGQAHCLNNLAVRALSEGRWAEALGDFRRAAEIFGRLGDTASAGNATFNQADVLVRQGRLEEAGGPLEEARRVALLVEDEELEALVAREAGRVHARAGRADEADAMLDRAAAVFSRLELEDEVLEVTVARAEATLLRGEPGSALDQVAKIRADAPEPRADLCRIAAFALLRLGRAVEADAEALTGLTAVSGPEEDYERGLLLLARSQAALLQRTPEAVELESGGRFVLDRLGVVGTPFSIPVP